MMVYWCHFKYSFPVFLKYATCTITEIVSITGMMAIINKSNGNFRYRAIPAIAPPKSRDPVSPINTCAGCKLNSKNPSAAPIIIQPNIVVSFIPHIIDITG